MRDKKRDRECEKESERERKRGRTFEDTNKISFSGKQIEVSKIQYGHWTVSSTVTKKSKNRDKKLDGKGHAKILL